MDNLNEMGLVEMDYQSLQKQSGGLIVVQYKLVVGVIGALLKPIEGAYEAGHDTGENNC
jgi:hypothetical protein